MLRFLKLFLLTGILVPAYAQEQLQGRIVDAQTREALSGVSIKAKT